jgi:hypothetical protein
MFGMRLGQLGAVGARRFSPAALFRAGEQGAWYDPSDYSTLFQDVAGTTPVTAVEQFVRLMRDKSGRGNHATAPSDPARPILRARYNLLTYSEEFDNGAWNKTSFPVTVTQNAEVAPNGTTTADLMLEQATTANHGCYNAAAISSTIIGVSYTYSVYAKAAGRSFLVIDAFTNVNAYTWFDLSTGQVGTNAAGNTASIISVGNGWYRCSVQRAATSTANHFIGFYAAPSDNTISYAGDVTKGIYLWGADLRVTNDALNQPAYQRVAAATDYDTAGFLPYLEFDGTDDGMSTSAIDFSATDKMTVFAGVRKLSDAAFAALVELSANWNSNNGSMYVGAPDPTWRYASGARGDVGVNVNQIALTTAATYNAPTTNVLGISHDISGDLSVLRINAAQIATATGDKGAGNFGSTYPLFIGARNNASDRFTGRIYSLIVRGAASSASEIAATENWVNGKTGAY